LTQIKGLFSGAFRQVYIAIVLKGRTMANVSHWPKLPLTVTASILIALATGAVAQTAPPNLPAAIICYAQADQSWRVGYLFRVYKNGNAIYTTPDGRLNATVNTKGVVEAPTNRAAGVDCYGKTLDELRSSGRIMEFQRTK
jgi:hypothetical protein